MSHYYNRRREPAPEYTPGNKVYLDRSDIQTLRPSKKLAHRFLGPYVVEHRVGESAYRLRLPKSMSHLHPIFPVVKLLTAPPDPVLVDGEEEYEVEAVINSRLFRGRLQYLIQWKGYSYEHNSWEDAMDVHSPELVAGFYSAHPGAPRWVRRAHFNYISFQSSQDRHAGSSLPRGGVM
jgi:Chromo (CHRromatin Organisation MOdifier) domain